MDRFGRSIKFCHPEFDTVAISILVRGFEFKLRFSGLFYLRNIFLEVLSNDGYWFFTALGSHDVYMWRGGGLFHPSDCVLIDLALDFKVGIWISQ